MTTLSKRSTLSDTMRSAGEFALARDTSQALAKAAETWFAASAECQREMMGFMSMRLEKDGEYRPRNAGLQETCRRGGNPVSLDRGDLARLQFRNDQADGHLHQIRKRRRPRWRMTVLTFGAMLFAAISAMRNRTVRR